MPFGQDDEQPFQDDTGLDALAAPPPMASAAPPAPHVFRPPMPPPIGTVQPLEGPPPITESGPPPNPAMDFSGPKLPPPPKETTQKIGDIDRPDYWKKPPPETSSASDDRGVSEKIGALEKPQAPHSNWAQRLAAILLTGRLGVDRAQDVIHPKYAEQRRAYEQQVGDITSQAKAEEAEAATAANVGYKEALAQRAKDSIVERDKKIQADAEAKKAANLEKQQQDALKIAGMGGKQQAIGDSVPNGYVAVPNLADPTRQWVVPPIKTHFTVNPAFRKMAEDAGIGGLEDGQLVDFGTWAKVADINAKKNLQENKPDRRLTTSDLAVKSAGGNPMDPDSVTPDVAGRAVDRLKPPREPRAPSAGELNRQKKQSVIRGAQQVLRDLKGVDPNDVNRYDYAEKNVRDLNNYAGNQDVDDNREEIAQQLQAWKTKALPQPKGKVNGAWRGTVASGVPAKSGAVSPKITTRAHVQEYANQKKIPYAQAEQEFKQAQYAIQ